MKSILLISILLLLAQMSFTQFETIACGDDANSKSCMLSTYSPLPSDDFQSWTNPLFNTVYPILKTPSFLPVTIHEELQLVLSFQYNSDRILPEQEYIELFNTELHDIINNPTIRIKKVILRVSCSPEGVNMDNTSLTKKRMDASKRFLHEKSQLFTYSPDVEFEEQVITKNWAALYYLIEDSDIPARERIIADLRMASNEAREIKLDAYQQQYPIFKEYIFPILRNVIVTIEYEEQFDEMQFSLYGPISQDNEYEEAELFD